MDNAPAGASATSQAQAGGLSTAGASAFAQDDAAAAKAQWRQVADQLRPKASQLATIMDQAQKDVLPYITCPKEHRTKLHSTNPLERLNGEIKRRTNVSRAGLRPPESTLGIFPK